MKQPHLSVVIPAYNEEINLQLGALDKVYSYLIEQPYTWDATIVDDGSSDHTPQLLDQFIKKHRQFAVMHNPHQGKAATVIAGMLHAKGDIVLFTDFDQATPITQVEKILPWFKSGFDVVIGSRSGNRQGAPWLRIIMARGFMMLRTLFLGLNGITDTQCGFKAFRKDVADQIFGNLQLYGQNRPVSGSMVSAGFDIEVLYLARKLGYKIKEVPVEWHYVETRRVNPIKDSWQGLIDIILIRLNTIKGKYI